MTEHPLMYIVGSATYYLCDLEHSLSFFIYKALIIIPTYLPRFLGKASKTTVMKLNCSHNLRKLQDVVDPSGTHRIWILVQTLLVTHSATLGTPLPIIAPTKHTQIEYSPLDPRIPSVRRSSAISASRGFQSLQITSSGNKERSRLKKGQTSKVRSQLSDKVKGYKVSPIV